MAIHYWTDEQKSFVKKNIKGKRSAELTEMFNNHFGLNVSVAKMKSFCSRNKLVSGVDATFRKGDIPWNKGKHIPVKGRAKETIFKKGHVPYNNLDVGTVQVDAEGYRVIKIKNGGNRSQAWKFYHRYLWEQKHGEIPKSHCLIFLNKDKSDLSPENIALISRSELLKLNRLKLIKKDRDLTKAGINVVRLIEKQSEVERKLNK